MDLPRDRKRKHSEPGFSVPNESDKDVMFVAKVEPPEIKRNRSLRILVGNYAQFSTRGAVQDILKDPAYFHCETSLMGDTCRILFPKCVDAYATHVVLLAALNPGTPLDCRSNINGLTLTKLHAAAAFLKIDGHSIGLQPDDSKIREIQAAFYSKFIAGELWELSFAEMLQLVRKDFLAVPHELDVYKAVKKWCDQDPVSRMTKEILSALLSEIRWELLVSTLDALVISAHGPLLQVLSELQQHLLVKPTIERRFAERHFAESIVVFFADQNQAELKHYNWDTQNGWDILLPREMKPWCKYKEMGPAIDDEHLLFRSSSGKHLKTWSFSVVTQKALVLFEQRIEDGAHYPLACINGVIYAWDFQKTGFTNRSFKFHAARFLSTSGLSQPTHFREQAAFETFKEKFYYCGGRNLNSPEAVPTVEVYDAITNKWTKLPDMQRPRRCFAAKVFNGCLYVTGGACNTETGVLNSCERLNLGMRTAAWEWVGGLRRARYGHCMIVIKSQLYVCGGFTSTGTQRARQAELDRYDVQNDCWEKVHANLRWPGTSWATFVMSYQ